ncbi:VPDSG-CTERM sorting domain-containing protein [Pelagicoccus sp. SDUM812003]|uniref:VPDSG-CTERM sorting domain-containing protein n=1 Tax=Pelagicoccus sp. SDUM812003 TaxID=3041267 RepID=UPI00280E15DD|nr:VPDSG-CTERM sorting domain-containing protein [Pelagicoccus sp. SDUM812003]MDQ8204579.1 VPDSG-CTERM sorting domain-containing protein [Pelagicoccus sp. SDUM812003]
MTNKTLATLFFAATTALVATSTASAVSLKSLTDGYDVFVQGNATLNGSVHVEGSIAVGGTLTTNGNQNSFGYHPSASDYTILANSVDFNGIDNGKYANDHNHNSRIGTLNSQVIQPDGIYEGSTRIFNFDGKGSAVEDAIDSNYFSRKIGGLVDFSNTLKGLDDTNVISDFFDTNSAPNTNLTLEFGASPGLKVISTTWNSITNIVGNLQTIGTALAGEAYVINVDLTGIGTNSFGNFNVQGRNASLVADSADFILWNFFASDDSVLKFEKGWLGSVLAPTLDVSNASNDIDGMIVARSLEYTGGEIHVDPYDYDFEVPDAGSTALLLILSAPLFFFARRRLR